ncbi:ABATE domain-containing protein [Streptomyces sp. AV19]|uniref:CGNR zinc finger domain-containing protein n=1 Tax=Streptomyces sp. AV19 TaxID=2793068 RepID=UPI0018FEA7AA|nr:ABATE domain-containing protein [Streptomyces sp. AV19]MBH1933851.1 ABATE domain-containing protein [Streptomyces sp. AV19]MDG4533203.1 ABATE domain-containing protein [Streptomyces sp. AV19]
MSEEQGQDQDQDQGWVWYGDRVCVDFVNTRRDRWSTEESRELLRRPEDLVAWFAAAGIGSSCRAVDDAVLAEAVELREAIDAGVRAVVAGEPFPGSAQRVLNVWLARAAERPARLEVRDGVPVLVPGVLPLDGRGALTRIAVDAAEVFGGDGRDRLRICGGERCSARFLDNSAGRRRRWCRMATCGNRAKAAQHRRAAAGGAGR